MTPALQILADQTTAHYFRLARLGALDEWWHWFVLATGVVGIVLYVAWMYRRDGVELSRGLTITLALLRLIALGGVLLFFLQLEKRADREVTKTSRALMLIDTSLSMGLPNTLETTGGTPASRIDQIVGELAGGTLLTNLRARHDVVVYRFDQGAKPTEVATLTKLVTSSDNATPQEAAVARYFKAVGETRLLTLIAGGILALALLAGLMHLTWKHPPSAAPRESWSQLVAMVALIVAVVVLAVANLRHPEVPWRVMLGLRQPAENDVRMATPTPSSNAAAESIEPDIEWRKELAIRGGETRIGDALRYLIGKERGGPIAGIVLASDGGQNAGVEAAVAIAEAQDAGIPVYTVGLGSEKRPKNVRLVDLEAPQRVYPGDEFTLTAYVQASGLSGSDAELELFSGPADAGAAQLVKDAAQSRTLKLGDDADITPVVFKLKPSEQGRRDYQVRAATRVADHDPRDNQRSVTVEVVDRKNKVLLFAGGPAREFRFLRNQLYRDKDTVVDVLLQSGDPEVAQEANKLLFEFPTTEEELFGYDCIVAFDPDWEALDEVQVNLLERWVAEKAGGLIVVAGPVHTSEWAGRRRDARFDTIKALYPVAFYTSGSASLNLGRTGGIAAWPLQFTRDGQEAEFLWLEDDGLASEAAWQDFGGVYGYFAVKDPKPGAKIYARFADPETSIDNELPIYLAGHFYGAGRVFFQASGEMWRVRAVDEAYFETYYTKLLRWVSQGRLMQDSTRGVLLVDKDRALLGEPIVARAILTDAQRQPLTDPEVTLAIVPPSGQRFTLAMPRVKDSPRQGTYAAQFTALEQGDYRVELRIPHTVDNELLSRQVRVDVPQREIERPERNDALLSEIARKTEGEYFMGMPAALGGEGRPSLAGFLEPQDQITVIPGTPDRAFDQRLMTWLMGLITGVLCLEWLLRRLSKLA